MSDKNLLLQYYIWYSLTLASAITGSDSLYCVYQGKAVETIAPGSNTVTNDMLLVLLLKPLLL
ncbi:MAG: hypothetical protein CM15mV66_280 [uncultured marine virus]|nr:MAG: hypothetical protein CM15mV66_280 [uncultured marine virus]